ncbi:unnamed protein product [Closterium sp. Naga37s-1]|nr:unnamed protein product [Closterium sp. Naga37s-1]
MDLENDGAAGTAAVWAAVSPPHVDGFNFHQAPLPCAATGPAENNEWGGGFMGEWAGGKRSEEEWGLEKGGDSWAVMGEEGMIVEGAAEAPPTPLIQAIARKNISASADVSPNKTATIATCVTNGWDPLHLNLQPRENVQENLQEKPQWQVGQGNDGSCLTTSPSAATSAGGGCASQRSLGGVTPSAATSAYAAGASFGPANVAPAIPHLTLPPSASFTGPPPSAAAAHGTGNQTTECGGRVPAAWFTPTATSATNVSPASLMSALGSLQGKIAALQLLIPLVAQSGPEPAVREQQEAAAMGVAAVIQQVALAAVGLLPPRLQAQLLLPDIAGVVRAEQAERQAEQEQAAPQCAEHRSAEKQLDEAQRERGQQEAMMMALAQALQLQEQQQQEQQQEQQQQEHEPQEQKHYPAAPSPPPPPPCEVSLPTFAPGASPPSAAPPPAPLAPANPLAVPAAAPLLPHFPPPLASPAPASPDSAAASGAGASTEGDDSEAVKEGEQNRAGGSKRGRDLDCEVEAAMGEGPPKQAKLEESQAVDAFGKEAAPAVVFATASRSASGTASEAAPGAASGGESMEEGYAGSKAAAGSADTTATATASDTATVTATASDSDEEAAAASSGGGTGWGAEGVRMGEWMIVELRVAELTNDQMHFCDACGKGFKREANLRMHIKGHSRMAPMHPAAASPPFSSSLSPSVDPAQCRFSCPVAGCKRHREHAAFQPLKTVLCVRNHYRRSHCPKLLACSRCGGAKRFAVLADLRTHEKHCGLTSWTCSCGSRFSHKDKLMAHLVTFIGHSAVSPGNNRV